MGIPLEHTIYDTLPIAKELDFFEEPAGMSKTINKTNITIPRSIPMNSRLVIMDISIYVIGCEKINHRIYTDGYSRLDIKGFKVFESPQVLEYSPLHNRKKNLDAALAIQYPDEFRFRMSFENLKNTDGFQIRVLLRGQIDREAIRQ